MVMRASSHTSSIPNPLTHELPSRVEAEMSLLGALLLYPDWHEQAAGILRGPEYFYSERHQAIYAAFVRVLARRGDCDLTTLSGELKDAGDFDAVGGFGYLEELMQSCTGAPLVTEYAGQVAAAARQRRLTLGLQSALHDLRYTSDVEGVLNRVSLLATDVGNGEHNAQTKLVDAMIRNEQAMATGKVMTQKTDLAAFDNAFGGVPLKGIVTILGVPGSGKSSLALHLGLRIAERGGGVLVFSYEMDAESIALNAASALASCDLSSVVRGLRNYGEHERRRNQAAIDLAGRLNINIVDKSVTPHEIYRRVGFAVKKGLQAIIVDYVQNLPSDDTRLDEVRRIESACRMLQLVARDFGILVILVSQMDKASSSEAAPPKPSDGKGSGAIREVSDMIVGVFRPAVWERPSEYQDEAAWTRRKQYAELHVLKNKQGVCGFQPVTFRPEFTAFEDANTATWTCDLATQLPDCHNPTETNRA